MKQHLHHFYVEVKSFHSPSVVSRATWRRLVANATRGQIGHSVFQLFHLIYVIFEATVSVCLGVYYSTNNKQYGNLQIKC
jgi:hypothetical protein